MSRRLCILTAFIVGLGLALPSISRADERNWSFSLSGYGGKAFTVDEGLDVRCTGTCLGTGQPHWGTAHGVKQTNEPVWGAKATAWYLHKNYDWQPQVGLEVDWTRFTSSIHAQTTGASGTDPVNGLSIFQFDFLGQRDFSSNIVAMNLLFRYPIGVTQSLPEGRWYPYIGVGGGVQRTKLTWNGGFSVSDTAYSPEWQVLAGAKVFLFRNLAIFAEWKRTATTATFRLDPEYTESPSIVANHLTGGVALHF